jgi:ComF family protein
MKKVFLEIVNLFYPVTCSLCGEDLNPIFQANICNRCRNSFNLIVGNICQKCGAPLQNEGKFCYICKTRPKEYIFDEMRSVYEYKGSIRKLILKFKYSNRSFLAKDFGKEMYKIMQNNNFYKETDFIIPVPLNIIRRIKRGYNQAALLANELSAKTDIAVLKNVLFRKKITKPQFKLSKTERLKNIKNSFFVKNRKIIAGKNILLVDDIVTTASTICACSSILKFCGASKVFILTLSRD